MFLPEIPKAVAEIARILKPDTWVAAAVWSAPEKNPYLKIPIDVIKQFAELPPPDPTAPGIFRLAKPGELAGMLRTSWVWPTFSNKNFSETCDLLAADDYFSSLMDIAAPIQNLWAKLSPSPTDGGQTAHHSHGRAVSYRAQSSPSQSPYGWLRHRSLDD